jgi:hypothetical protein
VLRVMRELASDGMTMIIAVRGDFGVDLLCSRYKSTEVLERLSYRDVHLEIHARAPSSVLKSSSDRLGMSG